MNVCKFCGHPHNNDAPIIRRPRPSVTQRAEDIIERRPPTYKILAYDLSKPRINELQNFSADIITVIEAVPADLQFTIRVNHHEGDEIPMKLGRSISIPFVRFFLTTPRYAGGKLKLMIGGEVGNFKFEAADIIQERVTVDVIYEGWADRLVARGVYYTPTYPDISKYRNITPYVIVTSISGTPTLDIRLEGRYGKRIDETVSPPVVRDGWASIYTFPTITEIGVYRQTPFEISEVEIRSWISVGGIDPILKITLGNILGT